MAVSSAILISIVICVVSAVLEGLAAGKNVKSYFAELHFPSYSPPLGVWYVIGAIFYVICFFILYRIFRYDSGNSLRNLALTLLLVMMAVNAFWNYVFFPAQNLFLSLLAFAFYPLIAIALFVALFQFDTSAAWALTPYLVYLLYAVQWGYRLWKFNPKLR